MAYTNILLYEPIRSIDSATFTGSFQALGTPLANAASLIKMVNNSGSDVTISIDGTSTVDICPAGSFWLYDITTNKACDGNPIFIPKGRQYLVSGTANVGLVYLVVQYIGVV